jgi:putative hydrolase of the HAD superfamily
LKTFNKSNISHIFFDLDYTLWDFEKNSELAFKKIFKEINFSVSVSEFLLFYNPINHELWNLYQRNLISQKELRFKRLEQTFIKIGFTPSTDKILHISNLYIKYLSSFTFLFDGATELLEDLKIKYKLNIITNGFEKVQSLKIKNSGLKKYFENIFTSEIIGFKKPDSRIFIYALEKSKATSDSSLMIGDTIEADIIGAINIGMNAIHFNSHNEPSHNLCKTVNSLNEIREMFK